MCAFVGKFTGLPEADWGEGKHTVELFCEALSRNDFPGLSPRSPRSIFLMRLQNQAPGLAS